MKSCDGNNHDRRNDRKEKETIMGAIYTVGIAKMDEVYRHGNDPLDYFLGKIIKKYDITTVVDVREWPNWKKMPAFTRTNLTKVLPANGVEYRWCGKTLGVKDRDRRFYADHDEYTNTLYDDCDEGKGLIEHPQLKRIWDDADFKRDIAMIAAKGETGNVLILGFSYDPAYCHRALLVGEELEEQGHTVTNIRLYDYHDWFPHTQDAGDGQHLEDNGTTIARLCSAHYRTWSQYWIINCRLFGVGPFDI